MPLMDPRARLGLDAPTATWHRRIVVAEMVDHNWPPEPVLAGAPAR
jgi:hypothetical protein